MSTKSKKLLQELAHSPALSDKVIRDFLAAEIKDPKNATRKKALKEIETAYTKGQLDKIRGTLHYYAVQKSVEKEYDHNQMVLMVVTHRPKGVHLPECSRYLKLSIIHQR